MSTVLSGLKINEAHYGAKHQLPRLAFLEPVRMAGSDASGKAANTGPWINVSDQVLGESSSAETPVPTSPEERPGYSQKQAVFRDDWVSYINWRVQQCPTAAQGHVRREQSHHLCHGAMSKTRVSQVLLWALLLGYCANMKWCQLKTKFCFLMCKLSCKTKFLQNCQFCMLSGNSKMPVVLFWKAGISSRNQDLNFVQKIYTYFKSQQMDECN